MSYRLLDPIRLLVNRRLMSYVYFKTWGLETPDETRNFMNSYRRSSSQTLRGTNIKQGMSEWPSHGPGNLILLPINTNRASVLVRLDERAISLLFLGCLPSEVWRSWE